MGVRKALSASQWASVLVYRVAFCLASVIFLLVLPLTLIYAENIFYGGRIGILSLDKAQNYFFLFWTFIGMTGLACVFIHLYDRKVLLFMRIMYCIGFMLFVFLFFLAQGLGDWIVAVTLASVGFEGKLGTVALGFVCVGFAAVAVKEAFCFHLYEGYVMAAFLPVVILGHLFVFLPVYVELLLLFVVGCLGCLLCVRKLALPLTCDLGNKDVVLSSTRMS